MSNDENRKILQLSKPFLFSKTDIMNIFALFMAILNQIYLNVTFN